MYVLPIAYRLWASVRLQHLQEWFESWVPRSVFSAGCGRSSVEAWYSTALDLEESLSGALDSDVHIFVADVVKSFDSVDGGILNFCLLGWFCMPTLSIMLESGLGSSFPVARQQRQQKQPQKQKPQNQQQKNNTHTHNQKNNTNKDKNKHNNN